MLAWALGLGFGVFECDRGGSLVMLQPSVITATSYHLSQCPGQLAAIFCPPHAHTQRHTVPVTGPGPGHHHEQSTIMFITTYVAEAQQQFWNLSPA